MKVLHDEQPKKKLNPSHVYRDLRDLVWPRRRLFLAGLALVFINRVASLVLPGSTKFLIDDVVQKHRQELLMPLAAAVGVSVLIQAVTSYTLIQLLSTSAQRLIADMRVRVQEHIGRLPVRYYDANKTGALVSRIMSDVEGVRNLVGTGLVEFIGGLFTAIIAFGLLLKINATLTFVALAFLLIFGVILRKAFRSIRPIFRTPWRDTPGMQRFQRRDNRRAPRSGARLLSRFPKRRSRAWRARGEKSARFRPESRRRRKRPIFQ